MTKYSEDQASGEKVEGKNLHRDAIQALAELTSKVVEQFHKAGELTLMNKEDTLSLYEERAKNIAK